MRTCYIAARGRKIIVSCYADATRKISVEEYNVPANIPMLFAIQAEKVYREEDNFTVYNRTGIRS